MLARHAARFPADQNTLNIIELETFLRDHFDFMSTDPKFDWLREWTCPFTMSRAGELMSMGELESFKFGERVGHLVPSLRDYPYLAWKMHFMSTHKHRTTQSASAFSMGLLKG
eukprot:366443_1